MKPSIQCPITLQLLALAFALLVVLPVGLALIAWSLFKRKENKL